MVHKTTLRLFAIGCLVAGAAAVRADSHAGAGWAQYRGPQRVGTSVSGVLPGGTWGLTPVWSADLGSGYSNLSVSGSTLVALFTRADHDLVGAFDLTSGEPLWTYELGEKYAGHDGSDDGPLSTPAIAGDTVYALGPVGRLVALDLAGGSEKWSRALTEESSTPPFYGYTSSPLVAGGRVIVATGGDGHAVTAFDPATGETLWSTGSGKVTYQSPTLLDLAGGQRLIALTNQKLLAIDPASGEIAWELVHTEGNRNEESAHAVAIDENRFLVSYDEGAKLYRLTADGAEVVWETNAFANSWAIPVRHGDHLYGFTGRFLTCASLETGEILWRSRPPQALGLTLVDGVLAVLASDGDLVLVDAAPDGYREIGRVEALDDGDHATPSFAGDTFFVRNLSRMAAVRVDPTTAPRVAVVDPAERLRGDFGRWVESVEALPEGERQAAVEARLAEAGATPITEASGWTHFVWGGEAEDVGLQGDFWPQGDQKGLYRVAGTSLFFRSVELDPKAQYTYMLVVDFGQPVRDERNPHTVDNGFAVFSELRMPEWPASLHLEEPAAEARGELDTFPFRSDALDNTRQIQVWRPRGYGSDPEARYPVLVVNHGDNLLRGSLMRNTLENLVGDTVEPVIAVFVPRNSAAEYGGERADDYLRFLTEELLPHLDRHYLTDGERRAIMGPGSAGVAAVHAALRHPEIFQRAAAQSFYPIEPVQALLPDLIAADDAKPEHVYVAWSRHDYAFDPERMPEKAAPVLANQLEAGGIAVTRRISDYSPGWGGWRGQHDEILEALFPAATADAGGGE